MKFIGHLDVMRYFQKVNRRAGVDIAYSEGFSPHQIMSFASPLGLGLTSDGEYVDMEVLSSESSAEMIRRFQSVMADGFEIVSYKRLPDTAKNAMSIVAAADYLLIPKEERLTGFPDWSSSLQTFLEQETIPVLKKTKKSEKEVDIRPMIYESRLREDGGICPPRLRKRRKPEAGAYAGSLLQGQRAGMGSVCIPGTPAGAVCLGRRRG